MKQIIKAVRKRQTEEAKHIERLENNVEVYQRVFEDEISIRNVSKCNKCSKMVLLDILAVGEACIIVCLECGPKKCTACDVYHVEEGVQEWKERQAKRRKKRNKIILG